MTGTNITEALDLLNQAKDLVAAEINGGEAPTYLGLVRDRVKSAIAHAEEYLRTQEEEVE